MNQNANSKVPPSFQNKRNGQGDNRPKKKQDNRQLNQVIATQTETAPFHGISLQKFNEKYSFGPQAQAILREKFEHLDRSHNFIMSRIEQHSHPYGAYCRKHFNRMVHSGLTKRPLIDVGGHAVRTGTGKRWIDSKYEKLTDSVHSMLPNCGTLDIIRHRKWEAQLEMRNVKPELLTDVFIPNSCSNKATAAGLCQCTDLMKLHDIVSIDSAYYEGVLSGIESYLRSEHAANAYIVFHDYARAMDTGNLNYYTPDEESHVRIVETGLTLEVHSAVKGNEIIYRHGIVSTASTGTWCTHHTSSTGIKSSIVYTVQDSLPMGKHDYVLVLAFYVAGHVEDFPLITSLIRKPQIQPVRSTLDILVDSASEVWKYSKDAMSDAAAFITKCLRIYAENNPLTELQEDGLRHLVEWLVQTSMHSSSLKYNRVTKSFSLDVELTVFDQDDVPFQKSVNFTFYAEHLSLAMSMVMGRPEQNAVFQTQKYLQSLYPKLSPKILLETSLLAQYASTRLGIRAVMVMSTKDNRDLTTYLKRPHSYKWARVTCWDFLGKYSLRLTQFSVLILFLYGFLSKLGVLGFTTREAVSVVADPIYAIACLWLCTYVMYISKRVLQGDYGTNERPRNMVSSCVTIDKRLDLKQNEGITDPRWKFRDPDWDIRGLNGKQAREKLGCTHQGKVLGMQVGPIFHGSVKRSPTVKHACKQCIMAAAIRATSNNIQPDSVDFAEYEVFFMSKMKELKDHIQKTKLNVDIDAWMLHYKIKYREEIMKTLESNNGIKSTNYGKYQSFPKVELQFTTVEEDLKDSEVNDVKERQISAPEMAKKIAGGVLTYALEKASSECFSWYCGPANWKEICKDLDKFAIQTQHNQPLTGPIQKLIWGAGDCSMLDASLVKENQKMSTKAIEFLVVDNPDIMWDVRLCPKDAIATYRDSEGIKVDVGRGAAQYYAEGRASGDSWTTLLNTWIVMTKILFAVSKYGFNPYGDGHRYGYYPFMLKGKGDDSLFGTGSQYQSLVEVAFKRFFVMKNERVKVGLGMVMKFIKWGTLDTMDFLSNQFFQRSDGTHRMVRIPARVFQSMPWSLKVTKDMRNWRDLAPQLAWSKGMCLLAWARGLPIFEKLARLYIEVGSPADTKIETDFNPYVDTYRVWDEEMEIDDRDAFLNWLYKTYQVTDSEVAELEHIIDCLGVNDEISHPIIEKFY